MIDRDDGQARRRLGGDMHGGPLERGIDVVDGDRVVRVGRVARDVADDRQPPARRGQRLPVDKRRDGRRQIDAVDEDVAAHDLLERSARRRLGQVPLQHLLRRQADLLEELHRASSAPAERTDHQHPGIVVGGFGAAPLDGTSHVI